MNSSVSKKIKFSCRWYRWLISIRSGQDQPQEVAGNRHVGHCQDCQKYYETWKQLESNLYHDPFEGGVSADNDASCSEIMAQIRNIAPASPEGYSGREIPSMADGPKSPNGGLWLGLGATCALILIGVIVFWSPNDGYSGQEGQNEVVESTPQPDVQPANPPVNQIDPKNDSGNPMTMLAHLQKEQVLIARDLGKFKTMLSERVIIFREDQP